MYLFTSGGVQSSPVSVRIVPLPLPNYSRLNITCTVNHTGGHLTDDVSIYHPNGNKCALLSSQGVCNKTTKSSRMNVKCHFNINGHSSLTLQLDQLYTSDPNNATHYWFCKYSTYKERIEVVGKIKYYNYSSKNVDIMFIVS